MTGALPNLVIAGVRKGGTTSLSQYLRQHPDICSSELKKVGYFLPLKYGESVGDISELTSHFEHCGSQRYRMEATTGYFLGGAAIAEPMAEVLPDDARVIIVLREPVDALWSHYRFVRSHLRIDGELDFEGYIETSRQMMDSGADLARENNAYVAYRGGFYLDPLTEWADAFGDRLRILFFDDLKTDAPALLVDLCEWLGIDTRAIDDFDLDVHNQSVQIGSRQLQRVALGVNRSAKKFFIRHKHVKRQLRSAYYRVNQDRGPKLSLDPEVRAQLQEVHATSNARVAELLQERGLSGPLPPWLAETAAR